MRKSTKKSLSLLVALAMVLTMFSGVAISAGPGDVEIIEGESTIDDVHIEEEQVVTIRVYNDHSSNSAEDVTVNLKIDEIDYDETSDEANISDGDHNDFVFDDIGTLDPGEYTADVTAYVDGDEADTWEKDFYSIGIVEKVNEFEIGAEDPEVVLELVGDDISSSDEAEDPENWNIDEDGNINLDGSEVPIDNAAITDISRTGTSEVTISFEGTVFGEDSFDIYIDTPDSIFETASLDQSNEITISTEVLEANFVVDIADDTASEVMQGSTFEAIVDVENTGDEEGTKDIEFYWDQSDDSGDPDATEELTLEGGETDQVVFDVEIDREEDTGSIEYYVASEDDSNSGTVDVVDFESTPFSAFASSILDYDDEVDVDEPSEFEVRFRDSSGDRILNQDVEFYVVFSEDASSIEGIDAELHSEADYEWKVEAETDASGEVEFEIVTSAPGEVDVDLYRFDGEDGKIDGATLKVSSLDEVGSIELEDDGDVEAGEEIELTATAYERADLDGWEVEGVEIVFEMKEQGDDEDDYNEIDTVETDSDGEAELEITAEETGTFVFRASWDDDEDIYDTTTVNVSAADADSIEAHKDNMFHNVDDDEFTVYFSIKDEYGNNVTRDWEDEFSFRVTDPEGNVYDELEDDEISDVGICDDEDENTEDMYYVEVDYSEIKDELGDDAEGVYEVRGSVKGTTMRAYTEVTAAEFGDLVEMKLELNPTAAHEDEDLEYDSRFENAAEITLIDDQGMEKDYKYGGEIRFSSSRNSVATIDREDGDINPRNQGETTITAVHDDGLRESATFYVGDDPDYIDAEVDVERGELEAKVTLTLRDDDGYRTVAVESDNDEHDRIDKEYDVFLPDALEVIEDSKEDFEDGAATFELKSDGYDTFQVEVVTEEGKAVIFEVEFKEEVQKTVEMTIGQGTFTIDGQGHEFEEGVEPFIEDDRTMLPFRALGEALGADVSYDHDQRMITTELDDITATFWLERSDFMVNDESDPEGLDVVPYLDADTGRTYMPVRAFSEALGADVDWDPAENLVTIDR